MRRFHTGDERLNSLFDALNANADTRHSELVGLTQRNAKLLESLSPNALTQSTAAAMQTTAQLAALLQRGRVQASEVATAIGATRELTTASAPVLTELAALRSDMEGLRAQNAQLSASLRDVQAKLDAAQVAAEARSALRASCAVQ